MPMILCCCKQCCDCGIPPVTFTVDPGGVYTYKRSIGSFAERGFHIYVDEGGGEHGFNVICEGEPTKLLVTSDLFPSSESDTEFAKIPVRTIIIGSTTFIGSTDVVLPPPFGGLHVSWAHANNIDHINASALIYPETVVYLCECGAGSCNPCGSDALDHAYDLAPNNSFVIDIPSGVFDSKNPGTGIQYLPKLDYVGIHTLEYVGEFVDTGVCSGVGDGVGTKWLWKKKLGTFTSTVSPDGTVTPIPDPDQIIIPVIDVYLYVYYIIGCPYSPHVLDSRNGWSFGIGSDNYWPDVNPSIAPDVMPSLYDTVVEDAWYLPSWAYDATGGATHPWFAVPPVFPDSFPDNSERCCVPVPEGRFCGSMTLCMRFKPPVFVITDCADSSTRLSVSNFQLIAGPEHTYRDPSSGHCYTLETSLLPPDSDILCLSPDDDFGDCDHCAIPAYYSLTSCDTLTVIHVVTTAVIPDYTIIDTIGASFGGGPWSVHGETGPNTTDLGPFTISAGCPRYYLLTPCSGTGSFNAEVKTLNVFADGTIIYTTVEDSSMATVTGCWSTLLSFTEYTQELGTFTAMSGCDDVSCPSATSWCIDTDFGNYFLASGIAPTVGKWYQNDSNCQQVIIVTPVVSHDECGSGTGPWAPTAGPFEDSTCTIVADGNCIADNLGNGYFLADPAPAPAIGEFYIVGGTCIEITFVERKTAETCFGAFGPGVPWAPDSGPYADCIACTFAGGTGC